MCGIVGILSADAELVRTATPLANARLSHRGPDDGGVDFFPFGGATLGFAQRRLSILDLSPLGHQPMLHAPTGCGIVFNGEIYNYRRLRRELEQEGETFRSGSDTEVLLAGLARYGDHYLERLEGMYAFGFFDPREPRLTLARDPAGIKPLYLAETRDALVFASEVRAILATGLVPRRLDRRGIAGFLAYGAVQHPFTVIEGIKSLQPGASVAYRPANSGRWEPAAAARTFWRLPPSDRSLTAADAVPLVRKTVEQAVEDHLVSDVPVGLFLSSGIDSTILAGLAAKATASLSSFTVHFSDQPNVGEKRIAAETAQRFGLRHHELPLPMSVAKDSFRQWLAALDEPSIDGLNVYAISQAVRAEGIKVALSGLGADELFCGYPSFSEVPRLGRYASRIRPLPAPVRRGLAGVATMGRSSSVKEKLKDMLSSDGSLRSLYFHRRRAMSDSQLRRLGILPAEIGLDASFQAPDSFWDLDPPNEDAARQVSQLEFRGYQGNMLLRDADANGMAFGLEIRVPFLDRRVLDLAHSVPGSIRCPQGGSPKSLLRAAFSDLLRPEILDQKKLGFTLPVGRWMAGDLRPSCETDLEYLKSTGVVSPMGVDAVWRAFLEAPESQVWSRALSLVTLGSFLRRINDPAAASGSA